MAEPLKICPICGSPNHHNATVCNTCGTTLGNVLSRTTQAGKSTSQPNYDFRYGETDLYEPNLRRIGQLYWFSGLTVFISLIFAGLAFGIGPGLLNNQPAPTQAGNPQNQATSISLFTNTPRPTVNLVTVTAGPPTQAPTPTPSPSLSPTTEPTPTPCIQRVAPGDDLISLAIRCGHRSLDVIDLILEMNGISDPSRIQVDQVIEIPWPTATVDPNAVVTNTPANETGSNADDTQILAAGGTEESNLLPFDPFAPTATRTLQPGVQWHTVQFGENIVGIAVEYGANIEILSQLNPEVAFSQCDFGLDSGGGSCIVQLFEGQLLRVPAPTPTPTLPPTASGSETPTPTVTPTFNAPSPLSPANQAFFTRDQIITLRWVSSGTLNPGEAYHIEARNLNTGEIYVTETQELFFIVPNEWQAGDSARHEYEWTVSIINSNDPTELFYMTQPRTFIWQGRGS